MRIGILAVQGDYEAHARVLDRLACTIELGAHAAQGPRNVDAMILPGGESTTMLKFLDEEGLAAPLRSSRSSRRRISGHLCRSDTAGARSARPRAASLGFADLVVTRNAYGRQIIQRGALRRHPNSNPSHWKWFSFARPSSSDRP